MKKISIGFSAAVAVIAMAGATRCAAQDENAAQDSWGGHCFRPVGWQPNNAQAQAEASVNSGLLSGGYDINPKCAAAYTANMKNLENQRKRLSAAFEMSMNPKVADMILNHWATQSSWHKAPDGSWTDGQGRPATLDQLKPEGGFTFVLDKKGMKLGYSVDIEKGTRHIRDEEKWTYAQFNSNILKNLQDAGFQPIMENSPNNDEFTNLTDLQYSEAKPPAGLDFANPYTIYNARVGNGGNNIAGALSDAVQAFRTKAEAGNQAVDAKMNRSLPTSVTNRVSDALKQQLPQ